MSRSSLKGFEDHCEIRAFSEALRSTAPRVDIYLPPKSPRGKSPPRMDFTPSPRTQDYLERIKTFMRSSIEPVEEDYFRELLAHNHGPNFKQWKVSPLIEKLKTQAKSEGLWNLFMPRDAKHHGAQ